MKALNFVHSAGGVFGVLVFLEVILLVSFNLLAFLFSSVFSYVNFIPVCFLDSFCWLGSVPYFGANWRMLRAFRPLFLRHPPPKKWRNGGIYILSYNFCYFCESK